MTTARFFFLLASFIVPPYADCFSVRRNEIWSTKRSKVLKAVRVEAENANMDLDPYDEPYPVSQAFNVSFPPCYELLTLSSGQSVASSPFSVTDAVNVDHKFRLLLYPRGGGHTTKSQPLSEVDGDDAGFGMSYKVKSLFERSDEKVGLYLQYLPESDESTVDATFSLRMKGRQASGPRFDVEWKAGMRFVKNGSLREGTASDFGAHLMLTDRLEDFMGATENGCSPLQVQVSLTVHPEDSTVHTTLVERESGGSALSSILDDIRRVRNERGLPVAGVHNTEKVRVGKVVVPILENLRQRPRMFEQGVYPGVEYRIMSISDPKGNDVFGSVPDGVYALKPIYNLVEQLERPWPVMVKEVDIPKLYTANMYNVVSAIGSLLTATFGLATAFAVSQMVSIFLIPSRSMEPTLAIGDVLLVEKVTPRVLKNNNHVGDVVLFNPPNPLQEIVKANGGRIGQRDLFVKRVAAEPSDDVDVNERGEVSVNGDLLTDKRDLCEAEPLRLIEKYIQAGKTEVPDDNVFVLGDCSSVSIDSRVWGALPEDQIVGKPLLRLWPLSRFGSIPNLEKMVETEWTN